MVVVSTDQTLRMLTDLADGVTWMLALMVTLMVSFLRMGFLRTERS